MLYFADAYFNPEKRCGYLVSQEMKRTWAAQLEVLDRIGQICRKYGIRYFGMFGTLLGAVRHKGYIPWDDDLDIGMLRSDYMRFQQVMREELPPEYEIFSIYANVEEDINFTRILNGSRIDLAPQRAKEYHGCPYAVGVDLFPLDFVTGDSQQHENQKKLLALLKKAYQNGYAVINRKELALNQKEVSVCAEELEHALVEMKQTLDLSVDFSKNVLYQLLKLYDVACMMFGEEESLYITSHQMNSESDRMLWRKECFEQTVEMSFENIVVPVPAGWDAILRSNYGDYMMLVQGTSTHGCSADNGQKEVLVRAGLYEELPELPVLVPAVGIEGNLQEYLCTKTGGERKVLLYATSICGMCRNGYRYLDKIRDSLEIFKKRTDILVWWIPHDSTRILYEEQNPELFREYRRILSGYLAEGWGILDTSNKIERAAARCDAFYGDPGEAFEIFRKTGKPMMRQNDDIFSG